MSSPVFHDPEQRRWRRFKRTAQIIGAILSIIFGVLIVSVLVNPALPTLGLNSSKALPQAHHVAPPPPTKPPTRRGRRFQNAKQHLNEYLKQNQPIVLPAASPRPNNKAELIGFYVNWDDTSFTSLKHNLTRIDKLIPEWLHLTSADGTIGIDDPPKLKQSLDYIRQHRPDLAIAPLVNNFRSDGLEWEREKLATMLANPAARAKAIKNLLDYVQQNKFAGISIDFENVPPASQKDLRQFMIELYAAFHPLGLEISQSVPLDDPSFDYKGLAEVADYLILMAYDEHESESEPGPVASQSWYTAALQKRFAELPSDRYVIAIGSYGYDWQKGKKPAEEITFQDATRLAQEAEEKITLDPASLNPTFNYEDDNGKPHSVWFLSAVTTFNQMVAGNAHNPRGFALWRLGSEDPSIWEVFDSRTKLDRAAADKLKVLQYGYDLDYEGKGEILKVTAEPSSGSREITYDETRGLITGEKLIKQPSPYVITRYGGDNKKQIALTFDDGPDAQFTPKILDELKANNVKATFFIVGINGDLHPDLVRRIFNEGHELGSHTFTHPNVAAISEQQFRLELNATERLIESITNHRTILFRPPYAEDIEPETPDQVEPLRFTGSLNYYNIGMQIDPNDWRNPGIDQIVKATIDAAKNKEGKVVLLHDAGGDRSQTVAALPLIIKGLRDAGYEFVPVSTLIGKSRDEVMPTIAPNENWQANILDLGFLLINWLNAILRWLFIAGITLGLLRLLLIGTMAIAEWWRRRHQTFPADFQPKVSIIVPAYNEEKVVNMTIHSLLASNYQNFDIIVVDDGSSDTTYQRVLDEFGSHPQVRVFTKPNGGKSRALNFGIAQTDAEIIFGLDADTIFSLDAIGKMVRHFYDPRIGAVAGNAKVGNRLNLLTNWQALEYITSQNLDRRAFDALNCITVVPGAIGAWRRDLVLQAGGFAHETLAEDADLTLAILRMGYEISYEPEAVALTEAPDTVRGFLKQRFRWMFGTLQAAWKHIDTLFRPKYGALGWFAIPNVLLFQIFFPLVSPVMDLMMIVSFINTAMQKYQHPLDYSTDGLKRVLFFYVLFLAVDFFAAFFAFLLEKKEDWSLLVWLLFQRFFYRQLMYYVAIKSTITAIRGTVMVWGKVERKATVQ
ncbi:MAG: glycosyltransferase [Acidobacteria bacterium]|nr:glycosyltransferase [Acidobacteriota bacterium]